MPSKQLALLPVPGAWYLVATGRFDLTSHATSTTMSLKHMPKSLYCTQRRCCYLQMSPLRPYTSILLLLSLKSSCYSLIYARICSSKAKTSGLFAQTTHIPNRRSFHRSILLNSLSFSSFLSQPEPVVALDSESNNKKPFYKAVLPLERVGGCNCIRCVLTSSNSSEDNLYIRAIVDTGSPYLILPSRDLSFISNENDFPLVPSFPPTKDVYGSIGGYIDWRSATSAQFPRDPSIVSYNIYDKKESDFVFGVMDDKLSEEAGGALIGLIRNWNDLSYESGKVQPRPSLLQQLRVMSVNESVDEDLPYKDMRSQNDFELISSFTIDSLNQKLVLSTLSQISEDEAKAMPLIDLRMPPWGDFVDHYACLVNELYINSIPVKQKLFNDLSNSRSICVVFDTGLTGCLLSQPLWDHIKMNTGLSMSEIESIWINVQSSSKDSIVQLRGNSRDIPRGMFYVQPISLDWFDDETISPYVIVIGQAFLGFGALTVDIDDRKVMFDKSFLI